MEELYLYIQYIPIMEEFYLYIQYNSWFSILDTYTKSCTLQNPKIIKNQTPYKDFKLIIISCSKVPSKATSKIISLWPITKTLSK